MTEELKKQLVSELKKDAIVAIIRGVDTDKLCSLLSALYDGGIRWAEITFNQSKPETDVVTAKSISDMKKQFQGKMHIGAGTVMSMKQAEMAINAGAEFLISPNTVPEIIQYTIKNNVISMPGAFTPTEIAIAYQSGADVIKVFPADSLGIPYLKAVMASMSHIPLVAVGGVNENNVADFLRAGVVGVGVGSAITPKKLIANGEFDAITELAKKYTDAIKEI